MRAYSYVRFSSEKQSLGDSHRRQVALAEAYAAEHKLDLDDRRFEDLGVSAFKGKNAVEGNLGTFLKAIDEGKIRTPAYLLVESLDRLSRSDVDEALVLFLSIINRGVTIVTLADKQTYSKDSIKKDRGISIIISITIMMRANEESATKSARVKAAWARKAEQGDTLTSICPSWLVPKPDGSGFDYHSRERVELVQRMFHMFIHERKGSPTIARELNQEGIKPFGWAKAWSNGVVASILRNTATYGTLTRKKAGGTIKDYYPKVIEYATYEQAIAMAKSRKWTGSNKGPSITNLFAGLMYCAKCGEKLRSVGNSTHAYVRCLNSYAAAGCDTPRYPLTTIEKALMDRFLVGQGRFMSDYIPKESPDPSAPLRAELAENQKRLANLIKLAEAAPDVEGIAQRLSEISRTITKLEKDIAKATPDVPITTEELHDAKWAYDALTKGEVSTEELVELRRKLQLSIRRVVKRVDVLPDSETIRYTIYSRKAGGDVVREIKYEKLPWGFQKGNVRGKRA